MAGDESVGGESDRLIGGEFALRPEHLFRRRVPVEDPPGIFLERRAFRSERDGAFLRRNSSAPRLFSSSAMFWLTAGCDTPSALAAKVKLPFSATAMNILSLKSSRTPSR